VIGLILVNIYPNQLPRSCLITYPPSDAAADREDNRHLKKNATESCAAVIQRAYQRDASVFDCNWECAASLGEAEKGRIQRQLRSPIGIASSERPRRLLIKLMDSLSRISDYCDDRTAVNFFRKETKDAFVPELRPFL